MCTGKIGEGSSPLSLATSCALSNLADGAAHHIRAQPALTLLLCRTTREKKREKKRKEKEKEKNNVHDGQKSERICVGATNQPSLTIVALQAHA